MSTLRANFVLPELQEKLDRLAAGALLEISSWDYQRLFGTDDVAAARLRHFARLHECVANHGPKSIVFRKKLAQQDDSPAV
jgi:hypothetical protein